MESVWDDKLTTWYLALNMSGALLCKVLWLYLVNLRVCLSRLGAGYGWWVGWAGGGGRLLMGGRLRDISGRM